MNPHAIKIPNVVWICVLIYRVFCAVMMQGSHVPDEYWQSLEVAYYKNYGTTTLTWEWGAHLRAAGHAQIFSLMFAVMKVLGIDTAQMLVVVPRVLQGIMCYLIDRGVVDFARELYSYDADPKLGTSVAIWSLILMLTTWFHSFIGPRTLINTFEGLLAVWTALAFLKAFPQNSGSKKIWSSSHTPVKSGALCRFVLMVGLGAVVRITSVVFWVPLMLRVTFKSRRTFSLVVCMVLLCLGILVAVDYSFYGEFVFTPWVFVRFNFLEGHSALFGTHPVHWYFTNAYVVMFGLGYLLFIWGVVFNAGSIRSGWPFEGIVVATIVYSFTAHKEFRFVYPQLLFMIVLTARVFHFIFLKLSSRPLSLRFLRWGVLVFVLYNIALSVFFGAFHDRGFHEAFSDIRNSAELCHETRSPTNAGRELHVWTGCHHTPGYAYLHRCVDKIKFMECPVEFDPVTHQRRPHLSALFQDHPAETINFLYGVKKEESTMENDFLTKISSVAVAGARRLPDMIVVYAAVADGPLRSFLLHNNYIMHRQYRHAFLVTEPDVSTHVRLYVRNY